MTRREVMIKTEDGRTVCDRCVVAENPLARLRGLLGCRELAIGEGLLLRRAPSIHTAFMRFPIDGIFLDEEGRVLKVAADMSPWRVAGHQRARTVIELPAGEARRRGVTPGDMLAFEPVACGSQYSEDPMSDDASVIQRIAIGDGIYVRVPQAAEGAEGALEEPPEARPWRVHYVAVLVGLMLAALALARVGSTADGVLAAALMIVLAVLAGIDIETHLLPNCIVLPSLAAVLSAQIGLHPAQTGEWLGCAAGAALFVALPAALQRRAIGMGDVKLAALLGAALGTSVTTALMLGFLSVFPAGLWVLLRHGRTAARSTALPLGPFLAFGAVVTQLA